MEGVISRASAPAIGLVEGVDGLGRVKEGVGFDELLKSPRVHEKSLNAEA